MLPQNVNVALRLLSETQSFGILPTTETYSDDCQTSKMKRFSKIVND